MLLKIELKDERDKKSKDLSCGYKRKLNLATAFILNPNFLILDEPTSSVDPESKLEL